MYGNSPTKVPAQGVGQPQPTQSPTQHAQQAAGGQQQNYPSQVIANINARNQVIDFRDNLNPATKKDYAQMHGEGGKDHARVSTIKLVLCDFSAGKGPGVSKTVSCNIDTATAYRLMDAARYFWLEKVKGGTSSFASPNIPSSPMIQQNGVDQLSAAYSAIHQLYKSIKDNSASGAVNPSYVLGQLEPIGQNLKFAMQSITSAGNIQTQSSQPQGAVSIISQDKIIMQNQNGQGKSLVTKLSIVRQAFARDGSPRIYPWIFSITNARAFGKTQATGGTTYDPATLSDKVDLSIYASDEDVYRCMIRVIRFIESWENVFCLGNIQEAVTNRFSWYETMAAQNSR